MVAGEGVTFADLFAPDGVLTAPRCRVADGAERALRRETRRSAQ